MHGVQPFEVSLAFRSEKEDIPVSNYKSLLEVRRFQCEAITDSC